MIKKELTYIDFNGEEKTETHYFHLTQAELTEMELSMDGGLTNHIEKIMEAKDQKEVIEIFKQLIRKSHGVRSEDGRRFIKNEENLLDFMETPAYSALFMDVAFDADSGVAFIEGIMPKL